jgi:hypothetical protein
MYRIIIYLFLTLGLVSCSSSKVAERVVVDYIKTEFAAKYDTLFASEAQEPSENLVTFYAKAYKDRNIKQYKQIYYYPETAIWPLDDNDIDKLKEKYRDREPKPWKKEDFTFDVVIKPKDYFKFKVTPLNNNKSLYLSKPVYDPKKKGCPFQIFAFKYKAWCFTFRLGSCCDGKEGWQMAKRNDFTRRSLLLIC